MKRVIWAKRTRLDLISIETFWLADRPDYIEDFYKASRDATRFLAETPGAGTPIKPTGLRKWRVGRTPYLLFYRVTRDAVRIVRVRHEHENWRKP